MLVVLEDMSNRIDPLSSSPGPISTTRRLPLSLLVASDWRLDDRVPLREKKPEMREEEDGEVGLR